MRVLLDTHAFIWWVTNDFNCWMPLELVLPTLITMCFYSQAPGVIKVNIGKLILPEPLNPIFHLVGWLQSKSLPIQMNHVLQVSALPNHHRDPFDRILIAQSS